MEVEWPTVNICVKVRLNILPTNFTLFIWKRENNPRCPVCNHATESMAHLLNGCKREFGNFYSRRHNRIADYLYEQFKTIDHQYKTYNNKHIDTIIAQHRKGLVLCNNRKPDIPQTDLVTRNIEIIEVTICCDSHFQLARNGKIDKYALLLKFLVQLGFNVKLHVLCFGSLGNITKECGSIVWKICGRDRSKAKNILKWCSISNIVAANYIWRNKKLVVQWNKFCCYCCCCCFSFSL